MSSKISALIAGAPVQATDLFPAARGNSNVQIPASEFATAAQGAKADTAIQSIALSRGVYASIAGHTPAPRLGATFEASDVTALSGSPTITLEAGPSGTSCVKIVTPINTTVAVQFPDFVNTYFGGDGILAARAGYSTPDNVDYMTFYVSQDDATYTNGAYILFQYGLSAPIYSAYEQGGANSYLIRKGALTSLGSPTYPMRIGQSKLVIVPRTGTSATVYLYGLGFCSPAPKGRICVVHDDGYSSFMANGLPEFQARDIPVTIGVIGSAMNLRNGYSTTRELSSVVSSGGAVVAHGPWSTVGNLYTVHTTNAQRVADMEQCRDWISTAGLEVPGFDSCYVWPQGRFQSASGDTTLLDAAHAAGFTFARGTSDLLSDGIYTRGVWIPALTRYNKLAVGHIGHLWAGTTAAEATNIANIVTAIQNLAAAGWDGILMLHRVLHDATSDGAMGIAGEITIRRSDLAIIAAAIRTEVLAGRLDAVTMPSMAINTWWGDLK